MNLKSAIPTTVVLLALLASNYWQRQELRTLQEDVSGLRAAVEGRPRRDSTVESRNAEDSNFTGSTRVSRGDVQKNSAQPRLQTQPAVVVTGGKIKPGQAGVSPATDPVASIYSGEASVPTADSFTMDSSVDSNPKGKPRWDHAQATGAPDTARAGDVPTAWAPKSPRSGEQWLALGYAKSVEIKEINIMESHNPGAISKVSAFMPDGSERTLWQGTAALQQTNGEVVETSLPVPPGVTANNIRVYVDTNRVQSWPEIDAVELVGTNGLRQWANSSSASSSYSEYSSPSFR